MTDPDVTRESVVRHRFATHQLGQEVIDPASCHFLDIGVRDHPVGATAGLALRARSVDVALVPTTSYASTRPAARWVLRGGEIVGVWRDRRAGSGRSVTIEPFGKLTKAQRKSAVDSATRLFAPDPVKATLI